MGTDKKTNLLSVILLSMRISFTASSFFSVVRVICSLFNAVLPTVKLLIMKLIIDELTVKHNRETISFVVIYVIVLLFSVVVDKLNSYCTLMHTEKIGLHVSNNVIDKVSDLDISYFDNPALYDEMNIATQNGGSISNLFWSLISLIQGLIQLVISFVIVSKVGIIYAIILTITSLPYFFVERNNEIETYLWNRDNENKVRKINYLYRVLVDKYFAIDLRVNSLLKYMKDKYNKHWDIWFIGKKGLIKKQFIRSFFALLLSNVVALLFVIVLVMSVLFKDTSIGDFTYYLGISTQLVNYTYFVLGGFSSFKQLMMKTESFYEFMGWERLTSQTGSEAPSNDILSIRFENVSFRYPNCDEQILNSISFEINKGEKVLLIGNNGSGKSTILKLLLRLYKPDSGTILLNDIPIDEYSDAEYYKLFSSLPQNYVNYAFSAKENISCSNEPDKNKIELSIEKADLKSIFDKLPNGMDTFLTKQFDIDGVELSVGEWQKMAMARFFYKDAPILILDEPSSSLDVFAQDRTLSLVLKEKEKTVLLITHRLVSLENIDRVISLERGTIIENGIPAILENDGGFFDLWKKANMNE